jgi:16S rRNA (cytosine1402-N4)-methyltransferase
MDRAHQPVLLEEAIAALMVSADGVYLDGTFGRGGHSSRILDALSPSGALIGFDQDPGAVEAARLLAERDPRFTFRAVNFQSLGDWVAPGSLSGVLLDLGVSSPQLDEPSRGFSFTHDGPLDMRMNPNEGQSAASWLSAASESEVARVLRTLGEERFARRIAGAIVAARAQAPIERTARLAEVVTAANPRWEHNKHPATRSFQAIRLHINRELDVLEVVLEQIIRALAPGGRMVVISFHSLEDRIVKRFIRDKARGERLPRGVPVQYESPTALIRAVGKAVLPSPDEVAQNPRSRSAIMRVAERL